MAARALACVADVLGCMAEGRGGLRSGPAANPEWIQPFSYLECGDLMRGVEALAREREKWLTRWVLIKLEPTEKPSREGSPDSGSSERTFRLTMTSNLAPAWGSM